MHAGNSLRLGTRGSALARWQAEWVAGRLREAGVEVDLVPISTRGDRQQVGPIGAIGAPGVFTKELQRALLESEVDLAVHSLKDLPTDPVEGLILGAVPARGPVADVLICREASSLANLPSGATVGTGSLRRRAQLWHARPDLRMQDVRGNVETRLRKLLDGEFDALVLAQAGLERLNLAQHVTEILPSGIMLSAPGQGALGIEVRRDDARRLAVLATLDDPGTHRAVIAERALLATLRGGCLAPVGAWGRVEGETLHVEGVVLSHDGQRRLAASAQGELRQAAQLGAEAAQALLDQGAAALIESARSDGHGS